MERYRAALLVLLSLCATSPQNLECQQPLRTIGLLDGAPEYTFAWIGDIETARSGRIYVLDKRGFGIRWYKPDGVYGGRVGRTGRGPGELRGPLDMSIDAQDRVHILDPGNGRISIYAPTTSGVQHLEDQRTPAGSIGLCAVGSRRVILSTSSTHLLHEIDASGRTTRSFGTPPQPSSELSREFRGRPFGYLLSDGSLHCDSSSSRILHTTLWTGEVRLYALSGELLWQTIVPDFQQIMIKYNEALDMCCQMGRDEKSGAYHQALAGIIDGENVVVSLFLRGRDGKEHYERRVLRLLDGVATDRGVAAMIESGRLQNGFRIGFANTPYPQVKVFPRR